MSPDLITFGETMLRLSPPRGERIESAGQFEVRSAGAESNVAITATRLGTNATWMSKVHDGPLGRRTVKDVRSHGTEPVIVWTSEGRQGTYYLEFGSEPRGINVVYDRQDAAITSATPEELPTERVRNGEMFYTSGITPALSEQLARTTDRLLELATDAGTETVFDLNYREKLWSTTDARNQYCSLFGNVDVLVAAERDARRVLNREGNTLSIAQELRGEFGFDTVVITRGSDGAIAVDADGTHDQPAFEAETIDPVGTGDAFVGGFMSRRCEGEETPVALEYGAATAAIKRTMAGDIAVTTRDEVEDVLDGAGTSISR